MKELELAALLCSRLCHDIVGPLGAVHNGMEILQEETDPDMREQAEALVARSALEAARRLQFLRLAFGASGGEGQSFSLSEAREAARALYAGGKISLIWENVEPQFSKTGAKLLLNMILSVAAALPRGGELIVDVAEAPERSRVSGHGNNARFRPEARAALTGAEVDVDARNVQHRYTALLAQAADAELSLEEGPQDQVRLHATLR